MSQRTLSVKELAARLNIRPWTVRSWIRTGKITAHRNGRSYTISVEEMGKMATTLKTTEQSAVETKEREARGAKFRQLLRGPKLDKDAILADIEAERKLIKGAHGC